MKNFKSLSLLAGTALLFSACMDKYDPSAYAPALSIDGYTSAKGVATSSLVAQWSFNGALIDSVGSGTGTNKSTSFSNGIKGQALQGALNSYVTFENNARITGLKSFTLTQWTNTPPPSVGIIGLFSLSNKTQFWGNIEAFWENGSTNAAGKLRVHINPGAGDRTISVDNMLNMFDKWVQWAVSYDGATSTWTIYANGSRVTSGVFTGNPGNLAFTNTGQVLFGTVQFMTTPSLTTGATAQSWASFLTGQVDETRLYDKALTGTEISALYKLEGRGK